MIRHYRHSIEREIWELPAGTREPNELPMKTALREIEEETGYRAEHMEPLASFYTSPGIMTEEMHAFVASDLTPIGQRLEHGEQIAVETVEIERARRMIIDGAIHDGKTIATLGTYLLRHPS